jgi:hypothetical protein
MTTHWKLVMIGAELIEYIPIYRKRTGTTNHRHQGCWMAKQTKILSLRIHQWLGSAHWMEEG